MNEQPLMHLTVREVMELRTHPLSPMSFDQAKALRNDLVSGSKPETEEMTAAKAARYCHLVERHAKHGVITPEMLRDQAAMNVKEQVDAFTATCSGFVVIVKRGEGPKLYLRDGPLTGTIAFSEEFHSRVVHTTAASAYAAIERARPSILENFSARPGWIPGTGETLSVTVTALKEHPIVELDMTLNKWGDGQWLRDKLRELSEGDAIRRDYFNEWVAKKD